MPIAPHWANGMAPESYQASITSGTRVAVSPQVGQGKEMSSTNGRCGSRFDSSWPESSLSSASEPTQVMCDSSAPQTQSGSGVPQ